jgi:uncharacterized protein YcfL
MKKLFYTIVFLLSVGLVSCSDDNNDVSEPTGTIVIEDSEPSQAISSDGFYVVNEDWFGHDDGTINYFKNDGSINYRAYRAANSGEKLGTTSQFATIYGGNIFIISKQRNRLVVADAGTLAKKAVLTDIGGDGRSYIGVSSEKGYIATYNGISIFNAKDMVVESSFADIKNETGNMCMIGNRVFAIVKTKGVHVINTTTDKIESIIEGSFGQMTQSKDGYIWFSGNKELIKLNPYTLESEKIDISEAPLEGTWFAWNAGSLCASTQQNVLYWANGRNVVKYDIDNGELNKAFYTVAPDSEEKARSFYAAGLRVDPLSDKLVLTIYRSGWGSSYSYNWVQIVDKTGNLEKEIVVKGGTGAEGTEEDNYYWFPAMPVFEDVNSPEILLNQVIVRSGETKIISLNEKIVDADNISAAIQKNILNDFDSSLVDCSLKYDRLIVKASNKTGNTKLTLNANSNGKTVSKEIRIDVVD